MSDGITFKLDSARFMTAFAEFKRHSKKSAEVLITEQAKNFVRRVIAITPPGHFDKSKEAVIGNKAKLAGETAIKDDLQRIITPASAQYIAYERRSWGGNVNQHVFGHEGAGSLGLVYDLILEGMDEIEDFVNARKNSRGRVGFRSQKAHGRKLAKEGRSALNRTRAQGITTGLRSKDLKFLDAALVEKSAYAWFVKSRQKRVGLLASGWNAAAQSLGYNPPAWIRRHSARRGSIEVKSAGLDGMFSVKLTNAVKFAGGVKDLQRRVQYALDDQARAMEAKLANFAEKAAAKSGFAVR